MQDDYQLTLQHVLDRMRGMYGDSEVVTLGDDGVKRAQPTREVGERVDRLCTALESARHRAGRPRRDLHVELAGAPRGLPGACPAWAPCCTRSTSGCSRSSSPTSPTTPRTRSSSSTTRSCRCSRRSRRRSRRSSTTSCRRRRRRLAAERDPLRGAARRAGAGGYDYPELDERTAAGLCYTSGTTGNPKGVLYSHRSNVLHSMATCMADTLGITRSDRVLPVVPMFHANAWGFPYACATGRRRPGDAGPLPSGASRSAELIESRARHGRGRACRRSGWTCCATPTRTSPTSRACGT